MVESTLIDSPNLSTREGLEKLHGLIRAAVTLETQNVSYISQLPKAGKSPSAAQCEYDLNEMTLMRSVCRARGRS